MSDSLSVSTTGTAAVSYPAQEKSPPAPVDKSSANASVAPFPSPVDHLDAALGIEVMQYVNDQGAVTQSFPSQRQLDAYRNDPPSSAEASQTVA